MSRSSKGGDELFSVHWLRTCCVSSGQKLLQGSIMRGDPYEIYPRFPARVRKGSQIAGEGQGGERTPFFQRNLPDRGARGAKEEILPLPPNERRWRGHRLVLHLPHFREG